HQLTGREYRTVSASIGTYAFPDLDPGLYTVTAKNGSAETRVGDVAVEVATRYVLNLNLQAAQQSEGLPRARNTPIEGATSEIGTFVQPKFFQDAPLFVNGRYRNPEVFVQYLPGVTNGPVESSILGGPTRSKDILLQGASLASPDAAGIALAFPAVEEVAELRLLTASLPAQYGRTGGGIEVFTTRSGGASFHGSLFDYLRNDKLD